jgi:ATP-binding cassette subfamily B protein
VTDAAPAPGGAGASASAGADAGSRGAATVLDFRPPENRAAELRRLPRLTWEALRLVWSASDTHLARTVLLQVASAAAIGVQLLISRELLQAIVAIGGGGSVSLLYPWLAALAVFTAFLGAIAAVLAYEQRLLVELSSRYAFDRIIDVSSAVDLEAFEDPEFFNQLQRARNSGLFRLMDMVNSVLALVTGVLTILVIAVVLFLLQPLLLVFAALGGIFPLVAAIRNGRESYAFEHGMTVEGRERQYLMELLTEREPAKELRIFGSSDFLRGRYRGLTEERERLLHTFLLGRLKVALVGNAGALVGTAVALGALILLLDSGRLAVASAMTAALAMQQLAARVSGLTASVSRLIESGGFIDDFQRFIDLSDRARSATAARKQTALRTGAFTGLEVDAVSFRYPNTTHLVLDQVDLRVDPGEIVALVGENGSGKTTLVKLICQLYRPESGRILWNGKDALSLDADDIRSEQTVLFQDYIRYHLSVRDNIVLGRPASVDEGAVQRAAEQAGADGYIGSLPSGYDTRLGRQFYGGHELSVGQWQRLALARAFFRDGTFLVLDEPTASLDPRAEAELFAQMRELARGRSVLLVSHRLSSVRSADRIYLLEGGRAIEEGDHDSLVARGGRYAALFGLQSEAHLVPAP